jgi:hypothetical protein
VINRRVEAECVLDVRALLGAARDGDRPGPGEPGELADQGTHRPAGRRDNDRFAGLGLANHAPSAVGSKPGHPQHTAPRRDWGDGRVELAQVGAVRHRVCAPPSMSQDDVAYRVAGVVRGDHRGHGLAGHDSAERGK